MTRTICLLLAASMLPHAPAAFAQQRSDPPPQGVEAALDHDDGRGERFRDRDEQSYVTATVNVRAAPNPRGRIVGRLKRGDFVNLGNCRGSWCEVDAYGGSGWVMGRFIGRGENPYHDLGPAGPGIPKQEPGTWSRGKKRPTTGQM